jgi:NAD(P)-dependent dehydrogenase (short-subunit alcohol dehydrogenase family)
MYNLFSGAVETSSIWQAALERRIAVREGENMAPLDNDDTLERTRHTTARAQENMLARKVALVVGASRGIGAATALAFARAGARVVLAARDAEALGAVAAGIRAEGAEALAIPTDVTRPEDVARLFARIRATFGRLDCAFNNAAAAPAPAPLADIPLDGFDLAVEVNLRGIFLAMREELPLLLASGGGAIVNMSSTAGERGVPGIAAYVATKHAILGLTKTAALDYAAQGVRVNAVAPGPILTERLRSLPEAARAQVSAAVPLRRIGRPEEVAATVTWLCSDQAAFITGATIAVDGGRLASGA